MSSGLFRRLRASPSSSRHLAAFEGLAFMSSRLFRRILQQLRHLLADLAAFEGLACTSSRLLLRLRASLSSSLQIISTTQSRKTAICQTQTTWLDERPPVEICQTTSGRDRYVR